MGDLFSDRNDGPDHDKENLVVGYHIKHGTARTSPARSSPLKTLSTPMQLISTVSKRATLRQFL